MSVNEKPSHEAKLLTSCQSGLLPAVAWPLCTFASYYLSALAGLEYAVIGRTVTLMWPPSGIALAAVMLGGYRVWPGIALGAFAANHYSDDLPFAALGIITAGDTLEPLLGAWLLKRGPAFSIELNKLADIFRLIAAGSLIAPAIAASLGTVGLLIGDKIRGGELGLVWTVWWAGDGMGVLVISPLLLTGASGLRKVNWDAFGVNGLEALALFGSLVLIGFSIFDNPAFAHRGYFYISLAMFPFAIWGSLRFGAFGSAAVAATASLLAIYGTANGSGPFAVESKIHSLFLWCLFADLLAVTGLILAAVDSGRKNAVIALASANLGLDALVRSQTAALQEANLELHANLAERRRMQLEMDQIGEERQKLIGQELHDGLGQQLTGIGFLVSSLHMALNAQSAAEAEISEQIRQQVQEAIGTLRTLSRGLYPMALEKGGLAYAIRHLAENLEASASSVCNVQCSTNGFELDKIVALNLYRITQEAVNNAVRHGRAQNIDIRLQRLDKRYRLQIDDDGRGFNLQNRHNLGGLGLKGMQNRAQLIGACLEFQNNPAGGISVAVSGPIH